MSENTVLAPGDRILSGMSREGVSVHPDQTIRGLWTLCVPMFFVTFSVCILESWQIFQLFVTTCCLMVLLVSNLKELRNVDRSLALITFLYLLPWFLSSSVGVIGTMLSSDSSAIVAMSPYGRLFNVILMALYLLGVSMCRKSYAYLSAKLQKAYFFGCMFLLVSAIWQAMDMYTSFPMAFPFHTRSYVHGAEDLSLDLKGRLTGYAAEPSYICPFIADGLLLSLYYIRDKSTRVAIVSLFVGVMYLTYSPSGYITIAVLAMVWLFGFTRSRKGRMWLLFALLSLFVLFLSIRDTDAIQYINHRINDYEGTSRFNGIVGPIEHQFSYGSWTNILFGYGTKGMSSFYDLGNRDFVFGTSNTLFADVLFDAGIIGLICYVVLFLLLFHRSIKCLSNTYFPLLLFVDLFVTSLYRADYASLRFVALIAIIYSSTSSYTQKRYLIRK